MSDKKNIGASPSGTWWYFQIKANFFDDSSIRRLRYKHGDTGVVIFIQLCAESLKDGEAGYIERKRTDMGESFAEELAFNIDRDESLFRSVFKTLVDLRLIIPEVEETLFYIPMVGENNKRLTASARSMRKSRAQERRKKERTSQSEELDSHSGDNNNNSKQQESELEKNNSNICSLNNSDDCLLFTDADCERALESAHAYGGAADTAPDAALSLADLLELSKSAEVGLSQKGAEEYLKITKGGLELYGTPIEVPAKALRGWAKRNREKHPEWFNRDSGGTDPADDTKNDNGGLHSALCEKIKAWEPRPRWDGYSTTCLDEMPDTLALRNEAWIRKNFCDDIPEKQWDSISSLKSYEYAVAYFARELDKKHGGLFDNIYKMKALDEYCELNDYPDLYKYFAEKYPDDEHYRGVSIYRLTETMGNLLYDTTDFEWEESEGEKIRAIYTDAILEVDSCPDAFRGSKTYTYEFVHNWLSEHIEEVAAIAKTKLSELEKPKNHKATLPEKERCYDASKKGLVYSSRGEVIE